MRVLPFVAACLLSSGVLAVEKTTTLKISGWKSQDSMQKTVDAVSKVKGVKNTSANLAAKTLTVTYDDEFAKPAALKQAVASVHFKVIK